MFKIVLRLSITLSILFTFMQAQPSSNMESMMIVEKDAMNTISSLQYGTIKTMNPIGDSSKQIETLISIDDNVNFKDFPKGISINVVNNIDKYIIGQDGRNFVVDKNIIDNLPQYEHFTKINNLSSTIVKLELGDNRGSCTGFLIPNNMIMTNYHCIKAQQECNSTKAVFNYYKNSNKEVEIQCSKYIGGNEHLDYALIKLFGEHNVEGNVLSKTKPKEGEQLLLIGHPQGAHQIISIKGCIKKNNIKNVKFTHNCDTEEGNSGSPIYSLKDYSVVGLHYEGIGQSDDSNKTNGAIFMQDILKDIELQFNIKITMY